MELEIRGVLLAQRLAARLRADVAATRFTSRDGRGCRCQLFLIEKLSGELPLVSPVSLGGVGVNRRTIRRRAVGGKREKVDEID